jgi:uncharacterized coiled-coil protein SlyX
MAEGHHSTDYSSEGDGVITTAARYESEDDPRVARLEKELACRDEVIVALQHVIRDLRHELENLRADNRYAEFALEPSDSEDAEHFGRHATLRATRPLPQIADALAG